MARGEDCDEPPGMRRIAKYSPPQRSSKAAATTTVSILGVRVQHRL
ncbi:hypothetical protein AB0P45_10130 [Streptomyces niveus]